LKPEILDDPAVPEAIRSRCYRDLARMHWWLGNEAAILRRIRQDPQPARRVLDIGCGHGALLVRIRQRLGLEVVGVDLNPPKQHPGVPILRADAITDPLPAADIAISLMLIHHLSPEEVRELIRNVGRFCRRFIILDLVRHRVPAALFRGFVAPFVNPVNVEDGLQSIARAFAPTELGAIVREALAGSGPSFRHEVAWLNVRQVVDIRYNLR
jgi:SAM-dependent methyltransferase